MTETRSVLNCVFQRVDPGSDWLHLRLDYVAARLADLAEFCSTVDALGRMEGEPQAAVRSRQYRDLEQEYVDLVTASQPAVLSMNLTPRLTVEIITHPHSDAAGLLTHPEEMEKWAAGVQTSWHRAQIEVDRAVQAHRRLLADGMTAELA